LLNPKECKEPRRFQETKQLKNGYEGSKRILLKFAEESSYRGIEIGPGIVEEIILQLLKISTLNLRSCCKLNVQLWIREELIKVSKPN